MANIRDLITEDNVVRTYQERKNICFVLKNGFVVKLDPNKQNEEYEEKEKQKC